LINDAIKFNINLKLIEIDVLIARCLTVINWVNIITNLNNEKYDAIINESKLHIKLELFIEK
jgi:hypothetical protein